MADYDFDSLLEPQVDTLQDTAPDTGQPTSQPDYDFDSLLEPVLRAENVQIGQQLISASQEDPDRMARGVELGDQYGIEHVAAAANLEELEVRAQEDNNQQILDQNPALRQWAMEGGNLSLASDDLENLSWWERIEDSTLRLGSGFTSLPGMGGLGVGQALEAATDWVVDMTGAEFTGERPKGPMSESLKSFGRTWQAYGEEIRPDREPDAIGDVFEGLGQLGAQVGLTLAPGGLFLSTTAFAGMGYNMAYERAKQSGAGEGVARSAGAFGAIATSVSERLGIDFLLRKIPKRAKEKWLRGIGDILLSGGVEAIEEYVEGVLHNAIALNLYDPETKLWTTDGREEQAAGFAAGIFRTLMHGVTKGNLLRTPEDAQREQQDMIRAMGDNAAASKLLKRLPTKYREFVEHAKKQGDIQDIFIPANQFVEYFQGAAPGSMEQVLDSIPGLKQQLVDSVADNKDLAIPLEDYATHLAGTEHHAGLAPDIRLHEGDMTEREAVSRQTDLDAEADAVHQDVVDRLVAAGVEPEKAQIDAETHRAYFRSMGDMFGVSPMEMYQDVGLQIQGEDGPITVDQEGFSYNQDGELQRTPAFDAWFSGSKVVDENGEPLVVYHGTDAAEFDAFEPNAPTTYTGTTEFEGIYFSGEQDKAASYARPGGRREKGGGRQRVVPVYLDMKNPLDITDSIANRAEGVSFGDAKREALAGFDPEVHDGVIFKGDDWNPAEYIATRPNQAKSIHNEKPTQDPRIMYQELDTRTPEFREWFGESKVVDENGEPLVVYRGDQESLESHEDVGGIRGTLGVGYFTSDPNTASGYALLGGPYYGQGNRLITDQREMVEIADSHPITRERSGTVTPVYLAISRPLDVEARISLDEVSETIGRESIIKVIENDSALLEPELGSPYPAAREMTDKQLTDYIESEYTDENARHILHEDGESLAKATPMVRLLIGSDLLYDYMDKKGFDGIIIPEDAENPGTTYIPRSSNQIKSIHNKTPTSDPRIMYQSVALREHGGDETLEEYGLDPDKVHLVRNVGLALEQRQRDKYGQIMIGDYSPEAMDSISSWMAEEIMFEMQHPERSGVGWYGEKFQRALDVVAAKFPEMATDQDARDMFTAMLAITSDGQKVRDNFGHAIKLYQGYKKTGKLNEVFTAGGDRNKSIVTNIKNINRMLAEGGASSMREQLLEEKTVRELNAIARSQGHEFKSGFKVATVMPMASLVFGSKLGPFYANLMGTHGYLTMDLWWTRTFNRYRGVISDAPTGASIKRLRKLLRAEGIEASLMSDEMVAVEAIRYAKAYEQKNYKNGSEIEVASNTIYKKAFKELKGDPQNASDREFMFKSTKEAQRKLSEQGQDLSVADIQAILWYYEKRLYGELGSRQSADISYEEAARSVIAGEPVPEGSIEVEGPDGNIFDVPPPKGINIEIAPDPDDAGKTDAFNNLSPDAKREVTYQTATEVFPRLLGYLGVDEFTIENTAGGFLGEVNPSLVVNIPDMSLDELTDIGVILGQVASQQSIIAYDESQTTGEVTTFAKLVPSEDLTVEQQEDLYLALQRDNSAVTGYTYRDGALVIGDFDGYGEGFTQSIIKTVEGLDLGFELEVTEKAFQSRYKRVDEDGQSNIQRAEGRRDIFRRVGRGTDEGIASFKAEVEGRLQAAIDSGFNEGKQFFQGAAPESAGRASDGTARSGTPPVRENGTVELTHWGRTGNLQEIDPAYHGRGMSGRERRRKAEDPVNYIPRTYFGISTGQAGGYSKERGLGAHRYSVAMPPERLYDYAADPDGLQDKANSWVQDKPGHPASVYERMVHEAGYIGYWVNDPGIGMVAAVFEPTNPENYVDEAAPQRNPVAPFDTNPMYGQTQVVPTSSLVGAEEAHAGDRASQMMGQAIAGTGSLRRPPSVRDNGDGTYTVIDGRSGVTASIDRGYPQVPVRVIDKRRYKNKETGEITEPRLDDPQMDAKLEEMYATNGRIKDKFDKAVEGIAAQLGAYPLLTTLKGRDSAIRKINDKYEGDPDGMTDLLRATIVIQNEAQAAEVDLLIKEAFAEITEREGGLLGGGPVPGGYSDGKYNMVLADKDGKEVEVELQINTGEMLVAKERLGHALYEDVRLLPKNHPLRSRVYEVSQSYYDLARSMSSDGVIRTHTEVVAELDAYGESLMARFTSMEDKPLLRNSTNLKKDSLVWLEPALRNTSSALAGRADPSLPNQNASPSGEIAAGTPSSNTKVQSSGISDGLANGNLVDINDTSISSVPQYGDGVTLNQGERGSIQFKDGKAIISLFNNADRSTFQHESAHLFLEHMGKLVQREDAPQSLKDDWKAIHKYLGVKPGQKLTTEQHETFARSFEAYLREGVAPSPRLKGAFQRFKDWLLDVYTEATGLNVAMTDEIRQVFEGMLSTESDRARSRQPGNPTNGIRAGLSDRLDVWRFHAQDKLIELKRRQQLVQGESGPLTDSRDAYMKASIWEGRAGERLVDFNERRVQPLLEKMAETGLDLELIGSWLVARHAREANAYLAEIRPDMVGDQRYRLSGMTNQEAADLLEEHAANGPLQDVGDMVDQINREKVLGMIQAGLISEKDAALWQGRYEHYVPLHREEAEISDRMPSRGQGFSVPGKESRRRVGAAYLTPTKIVTNVLAQAEATIVRQEKNRVGQALLRFIEDNPDPSFWHIDRERVTTSVRNHEVVETKKFTADQHEFVVKRGGEEFVIVFERSDPRAMRMVAGLKNLQAAQMGGVMRFMSGVTRFLSQVNTSWNPEFIISNFARDIQTAMYNVSDTEIQDMGSRMIADVPSAMNGIRSALWGDGNAEWAAHWEDFRKHGGKTGWIDIHMNLDEHQKELAKLMERVAQGKPSESHLRRTLNKIDEMNTIVENGVRLSAYKNAVDRGLSKDRAASLAKDLTLNFNRKGNAGPAMNAAYMFYNASVQGSVRLMQAMVHSKKGRRMAYATVAFAVTLDMINRGLSGDDDDGENLYDQLPDYVKDHNMIIMGSDGPIVKIPLPWGYNVLHSFGQVIGELISKKNFEPLEAAQRMGGSVITAFNPVGAGTWMQTISPTITDPIVKAAENKNFAGVLLKPEHTYDSKAPRPEYQMHWRSARESSKAVTKWLNDNTGGNEVRPGAINVSPEWLDMLIDTVSGGAGRTAANSVDTVQRLIQGKEIPVNNVPFLRRVTGFNSDYGVTSRYYEWSKDVAYAKQELKKLRGAKRALAMENPAFALIEPYNAVEKTMRRLRKARRATTDEARIEEINLEIRREMASFNRQYTAIVRDAD
ncbi:MAG: hypothetical protein GY753_09835 [Gammaproteobacteria bacterium]|nr:hypothetical protein [Gammaproteobacteria bacterium]